MMWAIALVTVCTILLVIVIAVALHRLSAVQQYTEAISNAWTTGDESVDYQAAASEAKPLKHDMSTHDARVLAEHVIAMQSRSKRKIEAPAHSNVLATYGPVNGPYLVGVFLQGTTLIYAFRGTVTKNEMRIDLRTNQTPWFDRMSVHSGFLELYRSYRTNLLQWLHTAHQRVYISGHSLGGALASMMALDISQRMGEHNVFCVTFGAPRVGDEEFAQRLNQSNVRMLRYANKADVITSLPLNLMPDFSKRKGTFMYIHAGEEHSFIQNEKDMKTNHSMAMYVRYMDGSLNS